MMSREERVAHWRGLVEKHAESGLSATTFCRDHDLKREHFYRWRRRFRDRPIRNSVSDGFLELVPSSEQSHSGVRLHIGDGVSIEVERGFDPHTLRSVIEVVGWK